MESGPDGQKSDGKTTTSCQALANLAVLSIYRDFVVKLYTGEENGPETKSLRRTERRCGKFRGDEGVEERDGSSVPRNFLIRVSSRRAAARGGPTVRFSPRTKGNNQVNAQFGGIPNEPLFRSDVVDVVESLQITATSSWHKNAGEAVPA